MIDETADRLFNLDKNTLSAFAISETVETAKGDDDDEKDKKDKKDNR